LNPATSGNKQQQAASNSEMKNKAFSCCTFVIGKGGIPIIAEPNPDELFRSCFANFVFAEDRVE